MEKKLVSVIVPCYNGEKYLTSCLQSILSQTIQNMEIIFVNDGSTDQSRMIAERLLENKRFPYQIIDTNGPVGIGEARNIGLAMPVETILNILMRMTL